MRRPVRVWKILQAHHIFLKADFINKSFQVGKEVVIWNDFELRAKVTLHFIVNLLWIDEERSAVLGHNGVRKEDCGECSVDLRKLLLEATYLG